jgi:LCP family protein required for cell wall assembly
MEDQGRALPTSGKPEDDKPYRLYRAGRRGHSRRADDELAGLRAPDRPRRAGAAPDDAKPARPPRGRRTKPPGNADAAARREAGSREGALRPDEARPRRRRFRWWFIPVGLFALLIILGATAFLVARPGYDAFSRAVAKSNKRIDAKTRAELTPDSGSILSHPTTILVLGADHGVGADKGVGVARSDTIMLMRFDPKTHSLSELSIPRDTRVPVEGQGETKINEAFFWGGPALALKTIHEFSGVPINHLMIVTFKGFPRLVDAGGGVDMYVPQTVSTVASLGRPVIFKKGWYHFDGKYAMLYVRIREVDSDFQRAARQQLFIQALEKKILQPRNILKLGEIGKQFMSGLDTDLTARQILELAYLKWRTPSKNVHKYVLPGTPQYIGGVSYVIADPAADQRMIKQFLAN